MGFNATATTRTLIAHLTPLGRLKLVSTNNGLITGFSLGDSDANYFALIPLASGQVPSESGDIGPNATVSNSTSSNAVLKHVLLVDNTGVTKKAVEAQSIFITSEVLSNGQTTVSGTSLTQNLVDRNDILTDSLVNLYSSFGLPLNSDYDFNLTGVTYQDGGFSDTALSGLAQTKILVFGIDDTKYGESLDGKQIKLVLPTSAGTYTIYSTFQNKGGSLKVEDGNLKDTSVVTAAIDNSLAMLFCDTIMTPNGGSGSLSWATGFGTKKPFSLHHKSLYNLQTNTNLALSADTIVGVAYLDKGFLVITHPTIVANYAISGATGATITFDSTSTNVFQNITCIADRGQFGTSLNPSFSTNDVPRISELGLYDVEGNLIAMGKTDRHVLKNVNEFLALGVKIIL
jgi:hypothetical protein